MPEEIGRSALELRCDKCGQHWRNINMPDDAHALLDAFYAAIPERFGQCLGDGRHAGAAASVELTSDDLMWLRGIAAAIAANHPLARMVRLDEKLGLYDDDASVLGDSNGQG